KRITRKFVSVQGDLNERGRRRWAAAEAVALGWGGVAAVAAATGLSDRTIRTGVRELKRGGATESGRQRHRGGGRRAKEFVQPGPLRALGRSAESPPRGGPMSAIRWTCRSTRLIASELGREGFRDSHTRVGELLRGQGYSLQANRKTIEGKQHPD